MQKTKQKEERKEQIEIFAQQENGEEYLESEYGDGFGNSEDGQREGWFGIWRNGRKKNGHEYG